MRAAIPLFLLTLLLTPPLQAQDALQEITPVGDDIVLGDDVDSLTFSPDGNSLLLGTRGVFWLCDVAKPGLRGPGIQGPHAVTGADRPAGVPPQINGRYLEAVSAGFSPDGKALNIVTIATVQRWDALKAVPLAKAIPLPGQVQMHGTAMHPVSGDVLVTSLGVLFHKPRPFDKSPQAVIAILVNSATGKRSGKPIRFDAPAWPGDREKWDLQQAAFSPDGKFLAIAHLNGHASLWDVKTAKQVVAGGLTKGGHAPYVRWSPDSKRLLVAVDAQAQLWDPVAGKPVGEPIKTVDEGGGDPLHLVFTAAFSPDGSQLAIAVQTGGRGHDVQIVDAATGKLGLKFSPRNREGLAHELVFLAYAGKALIAIDEGPSRNITPWLWNPATGKPVAAPTSNAQTSLVAVSPDGKHLATRQARIDNSHAIRIWRLPEAAK